MLPLLSNRKVSSLINAAAADADEETRSCRRIDAHFSISFEASLSNGDIGDVIFVGVYLIQGFA